MLRFQFNHCKDLPCFFLINFVSDGYIIIKIIIKMNLKKSNNQVTPKNSLYTVNPSSGYTEKGTRLKKLDICKACIFI